VRKQAQITQLAALPRSEVSKVSLLLIGTEHSALLIVDPQSYSAIMTVSISLTDASAANAEPGIESVDLSPLARLNYPASRH
jgi:hypothetical protein